MLKKCITKLVENIDERFDMEKFCFNITTKVETIC